MQLDQEFSELIEHIYQGALEDRPWRGFLAELRRLMDAASTTLVLRAPSDMGKGVLLYDGGLDETIATYNEELFALDPFVDLPLGEVHTLMEFVDSAEWVESELYKVCMEPAGLHDSLGADMSVPGELEARLRIARSKEAPPFNKKDVELCQALIPHLERAILIHAKLNKIESERALFASAVEQLSLGTIVLDEKGHVLSINDLASRVLAQKDGLSIESGHLSLGSRDRSKDLQEIIQRLLKNQRSGGAAIAEALRISRPSGLPDLGLVLRPVPSSQWSEGQSVPSVAIFISDPSEQAEAPLQVISRLFGFTPTEAVLALHLANGLTLDEAAEVMGVSRNTVRTHLRSVFSKTGVTRQTMLVRLILKSVAPLA